MVLDNQSDHNVTVFARSKKRQSMVAGTTVHPGIARTIVWKEDCATILLGRDLAISLDIAQIRKHHHEAGKGDEKLRLIFDGKYFFYTESEPAIIVNPVKSC